MNSWEDAPWRGGRAGGYSRRPLEGEPAKGSSSKSVRDPPPLGGLQGRYPRLFEIRQTEMLIRIPGVLNFSAKPDNILDGSITISVCLDRLFV